MTIFLNNIPKTQSLNQDIYNRTRCLACLKEPTERNSVHKSHAGGLASGVRTKRFSAVLARTYGLHF